MRLSTLLHATLFVLFATIVLLFLPALRSFLTTEGPIDEVRSDLDQYLALQRFTYLVERRGLETLDLILAQEDSNELREADQEILGQLATLRRITESEEDLEADEMANLEALEDLDRRSRRHTEDLLELSQRGDRAAVVERARLIWEAHRQETLPLLEETLVREGDAVAESLDVLLAASGHFAFVPFLPLEEKTGVLRASLEEARQATRFLFRFERLAGEYASAALVETSHLDLARAAGLADRSIADWRLHAQHYPDAAAAPFTEIEAIYDRFRLAGDDLVNLIDAEERLVAYQEVFEPLADTELPERMEAVVNAYEARLMRILDEIEVQFRTAGAVIAGITVALVALMLTSPWMLSRWVVRPVAELAVAARALGAGDLSRRVHARGIREMRELAEAFNHTAKDLGELHERLKRQERLAVLGELAGSIGHEVRNPLGAMKSSIFFLQRRRDKKIDAKAEEHLERIDRQIRRADRIITELLDYARQPVISPRPIDLDDVLDEVVATAEIPPGIHLDRAGGGCPRVVADPDQVGRIVENLLRNALQAMPDGGELRINCESRAGEVAVTVADTGVGISEENLARIFEPLVTSKTRGIGLGLPVARRYAELNGGRIDCESEPGRGSLFRLILPAANLEASP